MPKGYAVLFFLASAWGLAGTLSPRFLGARSRFGLNRARAARSREAFRPVAFIIFVVFLAAGLFLVFSPSTAGGVPSPSYR